MRHCLRMARKLLGLVVCSAALISQPLFSQQPPDILRFVPDDAIACFAFTGEIKPDANGTGFERWLAQPEIQESWQLALQVLEEKIAERDAELSFLIELLPQLAFSQPWVAFIENGAFENAKGKFAIQLGELESEVTDALGKIMDRSDDRVDEIQIDEHRCFSYTNYVGDVIEFGIVQNRLLVALGSGELAAFIRKSESGQPKWAEEIEAELPLTRTFVRFKIDIEKIVAGVPESNDEFLQAMKFDQIRKIVGVVGYDGDHTVSRFSFHCPGELQGFWKIFDVPPMTKDELRGVPESAQLVMGLKFSAEVIWKLIGEGPDSKAELEEFQATTLEEWGVDFDKDVIQSFGEFFYSYQELSLANPMAAAAAGIRIKDPKRFEKRLAEFADDFDGMNEQWGIDITETSDGRLYEIVPMDPNVRMVLPGISLQLVGDELLVGLDPKAISNHLRKARRDGGKLIDSKPFEPIFDSQLNQGLGQPIGVYYIDSQAFIEALYVAVPVILMQLEQDPNTEGMDFDMESLPPLEVMVNGIQPDITALYRTGKGFQVVERSTLPGMFTTVSSMVAMALPAVQQTRNAARRTMSQNNLRQLVLALHNHESTYRKLPAAWSTDDDGQPLLSWRVELLNFLGEEELAREFRYDEPWDSPHNMALVKRMPDVFKHPALQLEEGKTVYLGVLGESAAFSGKKGRTIQQFTDGTSNTLLLVEANREHAVYWTQPADFNVDEIEDLLAALKGNYREDTIQFALADASVRATNNLSNEDLKKMATISGGEAIDPKKD